jgi:hypothetical protein
VGLELSLPTNLKVRGAHPEVINRWASKAEGTAYPHVVKAGTSSMSIRELTMDETHLVKGAGNPIVDGAAAGAALGGMTGAVIGYVAAGTLSGAAIGASGFGAIGGALGAAGGAGWAIGTLISNSFELK